MRRTTRPQPPAPAWSLPFLADHCVLITDHCFPNRHMAEIRIDSNPHITINRCSSNRHILHPVCTWPSPAARWFALNLPAPAGSRSCRLFSSFVTCQSSLLSNRHTPPQSETHVTHTKQTSTARSNRPKQPTFRARENPVPIQGALPPADHCPPAISCSPLGTRNDTSIYCSTPTCRRNAAAVNEN